MCQCVACTVMLKLAQHSTAQLFTMCMCVYAGHNRRLQGVPHPLCASQPQLQRLPALQHRYPPPSMGYQSPPPTDPAPLMACGQLTDMQSPLLDLDQQTCRGLFLTCCSCSITCCSQPPLVQLDCRQQLTCKVAPLQNHKAEIPSLCSLS